MMSSGCPVLEGDEDLFIASLNAAEVNINLGSRYAILGFEYSMNHKG
jgi:hypothetical protein